MNSLGFLPSLCTRATFAALLWLPAAAAPTLTITIDGKAIMRSAVELGFLRNGPKDGSVIKIYEGSTKTGDVDLTMRLTQKGNVSSATLKHAGTYTLVFEDTATVSARLFLALPGLPGAGHTAVFTASAKKNATRIAIPAKDLLCDANAKKYIQFQSDGSIKVTAPAK